jgi:hypothetical protein
MDLFLNGERTAIDTSDCANLAELIARAEAVDAEGGASVVIGVEIDGKALAPDELGLLESHRLDGIARVCVERRPSKEVAWSVLEQGAAYTVRIVEAIAAVVDDYRSGRVEQANRILADILDSISILTGLTYSIAGVLADEARTLGALQGEIHPWLEEMLDAQTGEDPIRLADALEYEIAPRIERWGDAMRSLGPTSAPSAVRR